ncbi:1,4-alpha-glucan branching enzyme, partial [Francisella tularensis subsp. holarctica]|nr:1,4-alpha-glucan branching enzyme [Francisella tularensis subsp. holarctica]
HYVYKSDPYAFFSERRPNTASIITTETQYTWSVDKWLEKRAKTNYYDNPMKVYELHLDSWKTKNGIFLTYDELSETLPQY